VLPNRGVPSAVENGQNDDTMSFRAKVHAKRESLGNDTANIPVNRCVGHRPLSGGGHASFDFGYEFTPRFCRSLSYHAAASMNSARAE
jgi:hypothetical protein